MVTNYFWAQMNIPSLIPPSFIAPVFRNGSEDHNSDFKISNGNNFCTSCVNLARVGPLTQEITR